MRTKELFDHQKTQVFVSYATADRALAMNFIKLLRDRALDAAAVFWMDSAIMPSWKWEGEIQERLASADVILAFVSPAFLASEYCMLREMPLIRARLAGAPSSIRLVRLREVDLGALCAEGATVWPPDERSVQQIAPDSAEMRELRTWLKIETCKGVVARHSTQHHMDLTTLHEVFGQPLVTRMRLAVAFLCGSVLGGGAGAAVHALLSLWSPSVAMGFIQLFSLLGFLVGTQVYLFRVVELWIESIRDRGDRPLPWPPLGIPLSELPFVLLAWLVPAILFAVLLGAPIGLVAYLFAWTGGVSLLEAISAGALAFAIGSAHFAFHFAPQRLKVFIDVAHLFPEPQVEALPAITPREAFTGRPANEELKQEEGIPRPVSENPREAAKDEDEITSRESASADQSDSEQDDWYPKIVEHVRRQLTIVGSSARPEVTGELEAALDAEHAADIFRIVTITDDEARARDAGFWESAFETEGCCVVLMTKELAGGDLPSVIADAVPIARGLLRIYPILVDHGLDQSGSLMNYQGLPTGQLAVEDWPIRENAWINVVRTLLEDEIGEFLCRLERYFTKVLMDEWRARSASSDERQAWARFCEVSRGEYFVDPRHDFAYFPFGGRSFHFSTGRALSWTILGALSFSVGGAIGGVPAASALFAILLVPLMLSDTLAYAHRRIQYQAENPVSMLDFIFHDGIRPIERAPIVRRAASLLPRAIWLEVFAVAALIMLQHSHPGVAAGPLVFLSWGGLTGLACYLSSRYRVPSITLPKPIPSPHDIRIQRRGWRWTFQGPQPNHPELARARIGSIDSPAPKLIESYSLASSISIGMVLRALFDAVWIPAAGVLMVSALDRLGVPQWGVFAGFYLILVAVELLYLHRSPRRNFWRPIWKVYWVLVFRPAAKWLAWMGLAWATVFAIFSAEGAAGATLMFLSAFFVTFAYQLSRYIVRSSESIRGE
jgi:hypothetical protein